MSEPKKGTSSSSSGKKSGSFPSKSSSSSRSSSKSSRKTKSRSSSSKSSRKTKSRSSSSKRSSSKRSSSKSPRGKSSTGRSPRRKVSKSPREKKATPRGIYKVIIGDPSEYILTKYPNKVNNHSIFKIKHEDCIRHIFVSERKIDFDILFIDAHIEKNGILVKMNKDVDESTMRTIAEFIETKQGGVIDQGLLARNKIIRLQWNSYLCEEKTKISKKTKSILTTLDRLLRSKCNNLSFSLDYIYNMNGDVTSFLSSPSTLLLCLNDPEKGCISSIELFVYGDSLTINSKTKGEFEGKKYNKLLRAITIMLAPSLGCNELNSYAINPISTWLLMDSFNAVTDSLDVIEFLYSKGVLTSNDDEQIITKDVFTKQLIREYHEDEERDVDLTIDLTDPVNLQAAKDVFRELCTTTDKAKEIKCH